MWMVQNFFTVTLPSAVMSLVVNLAALFKLTAMVSFRASLRITRFVAGYVLLFHLMKGLVVILHSTVPEAISRPMVGMAEVILGASWNQSDIFTLPHRVLGLYQTFFHRHLGYLGFCSAQGHIVSLLEHVGVLEAYAHDLHACVIPAPSPIVIQAAPAAVKGWF